MSQPIDFPWGSMEFACYPKINLSSFWKPNFPYTSHTVLLFKIDKLSLQRLCWALYNDTVLYCVVLHISWHNYTACNGWNHILLRDSFLRSSGHLASSGIRNWCHPRWASPRTDISWGQRICRKVVFPSDVELRSIEIPSPEKSVELLTSPVFIFRLYQPVTVHVHFASLPWP